MSRLLDDGLIDEALDQQSIIGRELAEIQSVMVGGAVFVIVFAQVADVGLHVERRGSAEPFGLEIGIEVERDMGGERILSEANYTVIRTKIDGESTVFNVGFYRDVVVRTLEGLKLQSRLCVYDSEMIANSIIYPI